MAVMHIDFPSRVLSKTVAASVIIPPSVYQDSRVPAPVLYLLHGFSDNHTAWLHNTSIVRYASEAGLAVVMPSADNSFYTDMAFGGRYWTFLTDELPAVAERLLPIASSPSKRFVAGHSMGGFGALKWGLNHPGQFAAVASLSGVTDMVYHVQHNAQMADDKRRQFELIFGDADIASTPNDILGLLDTLQHAGGQMPRLYQTCGTEDFLYEHNRRFHQKCAELSIPVDGDFRPGGHTWDFWDEAIQRVLHWLPIEANNSRET